MLTGKKKAFVKALESSLGVISAACRAVEISRQAYYNWLEDEEFKAAVEEVQEFAIDFAESSLFKQIKDGNTAATIFFLKTRGRGRGYTEQLHIDHTTKGEKFIGFNFLPDDDTDDDHRGEAAS